MLFVLLSTVNHELVDVENSAPVDEERVEPAVECCFLPVVELDPDIVVDEDVLAADGEIEVGHTSDVLSATRLLLVVVKDVALAHDLKVRCHPAFLEIGRRDHSDLVDLLDDSLVGYGPVDAEVALGLQEVLVVVHVTNLTRDSDTFAVGSSYLAVVLECL